MIINDLDKSGSEHIGSIDICIVGSGPAGMTIARELSDTPFRVLLVESGGLEEDAASDALNEIQSVGAPRTEDQSKVRNRMLGGTSRQWSGRCAPLDPIDYETRSWIDRSGWPITQSELEPYFARAANYLGVRPSEFDLSFWNCTGRPDIQPGSLQVCQWQYSRDPYDQSSYSRFIHIAQHSTAKNVRVLLHATATQILPARGGDSHSLEIADTRGNKYIISASKVILAGGGIENARLLLASTATHPAGLGNERDLVGRFFMDHPRCPVGEFDPENAQPVLDRFGRHLLPRSQGGYILIHGLRLSSDFQRNQYLLNASAWLGGEVAEDDPISIARRLIKNPANVRDIMSLVSQPRQFLRSAGDALHGTREISRKYRKLTIDCTVEQPPNPESRITLSAKRDRFGVPLARVDWRIGQAERESIAILARHVADELARLGLPKLNLARWITENRYDDAVFTDFAHPMGTTRMSRNPSDGVVDENGQVHGLDGLYVAGSSVFPTAGHVNPTWTIVALAIRLADHLKSDELKNRRHRERTGADPTPSMA